MDRLSWLQGGKPGGIGDDRPLTTNAPENLPDAAYSNFGGTSTTISHVPTKVTRHRAASPPCFPTPLDSVAAEALVVVLISETMGE
jgi:hypothetical protein